MMDNLCSQLPCTSLPVNWELTIFDDRDRYYSQHIKNVKSKYCQHTKCQHKKCQQQNVKTKMVNI